MPSCDLTNAEIMTYLRSRRSKKKGKCDDDDSLELYGETWLLQEGRRRRTETAGMFNYTFFSIDTAHSLRIMRNSPSGFGEFFTNRNMNSLFPLTLCLTATTDFHLFDQ